MKQRVALAAALLMSIEMPTTAAASRTITVTIHDFRYDPATLRIHAGDRVLFINRDDEAHTATAVDRSFDSAGLDIGNRWSHVFRKAGTFTYFCALHPTMRATIIVLR